MGCLCVLMLFDFVVVGFLRPLHAVSAPPTALPAALFSIFLTLPLHW